MIENGTVVDTLILDPGRGYLVAPSFTINGTGTDLELNITINNFYTNLRKNINEISLNSLRGNIALIQQEVFLFSDSILNVNYF